MAISIKTIPCMELQWQTLGSGTIPTTTLLVASEALQLVHAPRTGCIFQSEVREARQWRDAKCITETQRAARTAAIRWHLATAQRGTALINSVSLSIRHRFRESSQQETC